MKSNAKLALLAGASIIAVLSYFFLMLPMAQVNADSIRSTDLHKVSMALEQYRARYGTYPVLSQAAVPEGKDWCVATSWGSLSQCLLERGISDGSLPNDAKLGKRNSVGSEFGYSYCVNPKGSNFRLVALAEAQKYSENNDLSGITYMFREVEGGKRAIVNNGPGTKWDDASLECIK